jgi:hypothetical protein
MNWLKAGVLLLGILLFTGGLKAQTKEKGGYCLMRVFDCNRSVGAGSLYLRAQIIITYETGETETIEMIPYTEKSEPENLKTITATLNKLKQKGYMLMSSSTTGEQGTLVSDYVFLKQF